MIYDAVPFVRYEHRLVLSHISYCEQIAIFNLFKINVFLYGNMFPIT